MRLAGERALVTGSTSGIGKRIATRFAHEGAAVVVTGRDRDRGDAVARQIIDAGGTAAFLSAELADEDEVRALVDGAADALGGLSILVNCAAAAGADASTEDLSTDAWESILRVNLTAPMWCSRGAIPHLSAAGGAIVNISSRQAQRASPGHAAYVASKGGLEAFTRSLAVDCAGLGVRANTLSLGYVRNERRDADLDPKRLAVLEGMHLTRLGEAEDVAHAAVYLASRESEFLTGSTLMLDGGGSIARGRTLG